MGRWIFELILLKTIEIYTKVIVYGIWMLWSGYTQGHHLWDDE